MDTGIITIPVCAITGIASFDFFWTLIVMQGMIIFGITSIIQLLSRT